MRQPNPHSATLDYSEQEDREAERNVRPPPRTKPPRHDLRRHRMEMDSDQDTKPDRDLSLNYKTVGVRLGARQVKRDEPNKKPGDYWKADTAWGVWPAEAEHPTSAADEASAKAMAQGKEDEDSQAPEQAPDPEQNPGQDREDRLERLRKNFRDKLKSDLKPSPLVDKILDLGESDFDTAMEAFDSHISEVAGQIGRRGLDWVSQSVNLAETSWRGEPNPSQLGEHVAASVVVDRLLSDPAKVAGKSLSRKFNPKDREASAKASYSVYQEVSSKVRQAALDKSVELLANLPEKDPRRDHLEARIDGLALACYLNDEDPAGKDPAGKGPESKSVQLRPQMAPSFAKLAKMLARSGQATMLLVPPEDFFGPVGRGAISQALEEADEEDLSDLLREGPFEDLGGLFDSDHGPKLGAGQKAVLRDVIRRLVLEDSTTVQAVLSSTKSREPKRRNGPKSLRSDLAKRAKRDERLRSAAKNLMSDLFASDADEAKIESSVSKLILAGVQSLDTLIKQLLSAGEIDPISLDNPHLAKVRHALQTGDISVLSAKVVSPQSLSSLSSTPEQKENFSMSTKPTSTTPKKASQMPPQVRAARVKIANQIDQVALALQENQKGLGISPQAIQAFTQVADKVADYLDGGSAKQAAAKYVATKQAATKQAADFNPEDIGREVSGPLEDHTPDDDTFGGEFTQQENRELGDRLESGDLDPGNTTPEPRAPRPGIQASSLQALKQLEQQAKTLRKGIQAGLIKVSPNHATDLTRAATLATRVLRDKAKS